MSHGHAEPCRRAVVEVVDRVAIEANHLLEAADDFRELVEALNEIVLRGRRQGPEARQSDAVRWKLSAGRGINSRNVCGWASKSRAAAARPTSTDHRRRCEGGMIADIDGPVENGGHDPSPGPG